MEILKVFEKNKFSDYLDDFEKKLKAEVPSFPDLFALQEAKVEKAEKKLLDVLKISKEDLTNKIKLFRNLNNQELNRINMNLSSGNTAVTAINQNFVALRDELRNALMHKNSANNEIQAANLKIEKVFKEFFTLTYKLQKSICSIMSGSFEKLLVYPFDNSTSPKTSETYLNHWISNWIFYFTEHSLKGLKSEQNVIPLHFYKKFFIEDLQLKELFVGIRFLVMKLDDDSNTIELSRSQIEYEYTFFNIKYFFLTFLKNSHFYSYANSQLDLSGKSGYDSITNENILKIFAPIYTDNLAMDQE